VAQKSAAANAPTAANRAEFSRSQKRCGAGSLGCAIAGTKATAAAGVGSADNMGAVAVGMGADGSSTTAVAAAPAGRGFPKDDVKSEGEISWANTDPDCARAKASVSRKDRSAAS